MTSVSDASGSFAEVLRHAIDERGLGLVRLRDRLGDRGVGVSVATLSYWQSGRSQPERKHSLAALPHLEEVLQLPPGTLQEALNPPRQRGRRSPIEAIDDLYPDGRLSRVLGTLDTRWDAELDRISLHDVITVGSDGTCHALLVRQVLRARTDGPDRRVVVHTVDDGHAALPVIRPSAGCRAGHMSSDADAGVVGMELLFHRPLRRGETVLLEYAVATRPPRPQEAEYYRRHRLPLREYVLEAHFDPLAPPPQCERFCPDDGTGQPLDVGPDHRVHLVDVDRAPGACGIRWWWPGGSPPFTT